MAARVRPALGKTNCLETMLVGSCKFGMGFFGLRERERGGNLLPTSSE